MKLKNYFIIWWIPLVVYLFIHGIFILGCVLQRDWIIDIFIYLFFINILGTLISSIVQITIKKWYFIIPQIGITILLVIYLSIIFMFSPPDYYGVHKKIPQGINISSPLEREPTENDYSQNSLVISSSFQPGIYIYYTNYSPTELGFLYIKAFEITSKDKLSEDRIKKRSKIVINDLEKKLHQGRFTIYEGTWGYKYASRIELWFKPYNDKEFKVTERNYIVEGWMR